MKGLKRNFTGRQFTDQELEIVQTRRKMGFYANHNIPAALGVYEASNPNVQALRVQNYFEDLVSRFTSIENLPHFSSGKAESETVSLHCLDAHGRPSLPKNTTSGEGFALAMRVLPKILYYNLVVRLQQEMSFMLESKTTDDKQLERITTLLNQYGNTAFGGVWLRIELKC